MAVFFYKVPSVFFQAFSQVGITPQNVTEIPPPSTQDTIIWYARTEEDILIYDQMQGFQRKIILATEGLTLENRSVTALLLRQANVEMYFPFTAAHIPEILAPARHWYTSEISMQNNNVERESLPILFSGTGKDSLAVWGPPQVGKTSVILSLAAALAKTKAKVLLIDATNNSDLLYRVKLTTPPTPIFLQSIYDTLLKRETVKLFHMTDHLDVIPNNSKNTSNTSSDIFLHVVDSLKKDYHFILFDTSSEPNELGRTALRLVSRILIVTNYDLLPLTFWHENIFVSSLFPANKFTMCVNGAYSSRFQRQNILSDFLEMPSVGKIPVAYETCVDAKIGYTSPFLIADDSYKLAVESLMSELWGIEKPVVSQSHFKLLLDNIKKGW